MCSVAAAAASWRALGSSPLGEAVLSSLCARNAWRLSSPGRCLLSARTVSTLPPPGSDGTDGRAPDGSSGVSSAQLSQAERAAIVLPMPKLSHAMTSGRIAKWHAREGAPVAMYDVLLTVETESLVEEAYRVDQFAGTVALLVESQEEGYVSRLLAAEGEEVPVGRPIAVLCELEQDVGPMGQAVDSGGLLGGVQDVYQRQRSATGAPLRLLEWQSYLAQGPKSTGCL